MVCLENIDLDTLISIIKKKKTVCFGAGLQGRRVDVYFSDAAAPGGTIGYDNRIG